MRSFRTRFALICTAALLFGFALFGAASQVFLRQRLVADLDRDLVRRGERFMNGGRPRGEGQPEQPDRRFGNPGGPRQEGPRQDQPRQFFDPQADEIARIRNPRVLAPDGSLIGPPNETEGFSREGAAIAARTRRPDLRFVNWNGRQLRVASVAQGPRERVDQVVQFAQEMDGINESLRALLQVLLLLAIPAAAASAGMGYWLAGRALKPVARISETAQRIGGENLGARIPVVGSDELADLSTTLNQLLDRLESSFSDREAAYHRLESAMESQRRFTSDASHELRTPLTRIKLIAGAALAQGDDVPEMKSALKQIDQAATAMTDLVAQLLTLARHEGGLSLALEKLDLAHVGEDARGMCPGGERVLVEVGSLQVLGQSTALRQVLVNLIDNAIRHCPEGRVGVRAIESNGQVKITVWDEGEGIPAADLQKVKDRFYRVDESRARNSGGAGLGLAICESLLGAMSSTLEIESQPGVGTKMNFWLTSASS